MVKKPTHPGEILDELYIKPIIKNGEFLRVRHNYGSARSAIA
ncbi:MAG: hypothetical protein NTX49_00485 [Chlamydiae bacterium]|nr:hypothetical protein [Chlamydiota bacterium]